MTFIFHNIWDNPSHWLIFFREVETTNQETDYELSGCISNLQSSWTTGGLHCAVMSISHLHHATRAFPAEFSEQVPNFNRAWAINHYKSGDLTSLHHHNQPWNYHPGHVFLVVTNWGSPPFFRNGRVYVAWTSPTNKIGTPGSVGWSSTYTPYDIMVI